MMGDVDYKTPASLTPMTFADMRFRLRRPESLGTFSKLVLMGTWPDDHQAGGGGGGGVSVVAFHHCSS